MADPTDVAKFEPTNFVDKLRDKMKQSMIDLIPEEQWNAMLKAELDSFFSDKTDRNAYSYNTVPSELKQVIRRILNEEIQKKVREMLHSPEWSAQWKNNEMIAGEKIAELLKEHGAQILNAWLAGAIQQVVTSMRSHSGSY